MKNIIRTIVAIMIIAHSSFITYEHCYYNYYKLILLLHKYVFILIITYLLNINMWLCLYFRMPIRWLKLRVTLVDVNPPCVY